MCPVRTECVDANLCILRRTALSLSTNNRTMKAGIKSKNLAAVRSDDYMAEVEAGGRQLSFFSGACQAGATIFGRGWIIVNRCPTDRCVESRRSIRSYSNQFGKLPQNLASRPTEQNANHEQAYCLVANSFAPVAQNR